MQARPGAARQNDALALFRQNIVPLIGWRDYRARARAGTRLFGGAVFRDYDVVLVNRATPQASVESVTAESGCTGATLRTRRLACFQIANALPQKSARLDFCS
jgi:hypothetical protein